MRCDCKSTSCRLSRTVRGLKLGQWLRPRPGGPDSWLLQLVRCSLLVIGSRQANCTICARARGEISAGWPNGRVGPPACAHYQRPAEGRPSLSVSAKTQSACACTPHAIGRPAETRAISRDRSLGSGDFAALQQERHAAITDCLIPLPRTTGIQTLPVWPHDQ